MSVIREKAANWIILLEEADTVQQELLHRECEAWQTEHPKNRQIYKQMQKMWSAVGHESKPRKKYRTVKNTLLALVGLFFFIQIPWKFITADYKTIAGETLAIELPDGSRAILNANSAINVNYTSDTREIRLVKGEVFVDVEKDSREFGVISEHLLAQALGTRYSVTKYTDYTEVDVYESKVAVMPINNKNSLTTLHPGQKALFNESNIIQQQQVSSTDLDWVHGYLEFNNAALIDVVIRISEYHQGKIFVSKKLRDSGLRFTGILPLENSNAAIMILSDSLGLDVNTWTSHIVRLDIEEY